jgi:DNA polymerase IV
MARYAEVSRQVMAGARRPSPRGSSRSRSTRPIWMSPGLERLIGPPEVIGRRAKAAIREAVGLTASVGIGPEPPDRQARLRGPQARWAHRGAPEEVRAFLDPMPLSVLRGSAPKTAPRLDAPGACGRSATCAPRPLEELRRHLGAQAGTQVHLQARGIADDGSTPSHRTPVDLQGDDLRRGRRGPEVLRDTLRWAAQEVGLPGPPRGLRARWSPEDPPAPLRDPHPLAHPTGADRERHRALPRRLGRSTRPSPGRAGRCG